MTQPTAVQWMTANIQLIIDFSDGKLTQEVLDEIYKQALKFEKEQIIDARENGIDTVITQRLTSSEQYYKETFKSE